MDKYVPLNLDVAYETAKLKLDTAKELYAQHRYIHALDELNAIELDGMSSTNCAEIMKSRDELIDKCKEYYRRSNACEKELDKIEALLNAGGARDLAVRLSEQVCDNFPDCALAWNYLATQIYYQYYDDPSGKSKKEYEDKVVSALLKMYETLSFFDDEYFYEESVACAGIWGRYFSRDLSRVEKARIDLWNLVFNQICQTKMKCGIKSLFEDTCYYYYERENECNSVDATTVMVLTVICFPVGGMVYALIKGAMGRKKKKIMQELYMFPKLTEEQLAMAKRKTPLTYISRDDIVKEGRRYLMNSPYALW